ncbi:MAG TPA: hypothetical protein VMJ34_08345 [Bryobacteraceae bacterium]|nr:hypothetical protein [Bryobacteraceae bacterium]
MRLRWLAVSALVLAPTVFGAEEKDDESKWTPWLWVNFVILAGGLGYLVGKNAGGFFRNRTESIQKDMAESAQLRAEAEAKAREMEQRLAAMGAEIDKLRAEAQAAFSAEGERIREETEKHLARVQQQTEREIDSMGKNARADLQAYTAKLALDLAEERIRARMDEPAQARLLDRFARQLATSRPEERQ